MIKYNEVRDELSYRNNRGDVVKIGAKSKKRIPLLVKYICAEVASGKSLTEIIPLKSKVFPPHVELIDLLHSKEYKLEYGKAENVRVRLMHERFISVLNALSRDPEDKNKQELMKAISNAMKSLEKAGGTKENIQIVFNQNFPEDMWK